MLNLMKPHELATIFGIIEDLLACNKSFLDNLHARQKQAEDKVVGSVADIISDFVGEGRAPPAGVGFRRGQQTLTSIRLGAPRGCSRNATLQASSMVNVYSTYCGNQRHGKELLKQKMRNPAIAEAIAVRERGAAAAVRGGTFHLTLLSARFVCLAAAAPELGAGAAAAGHYRLFGSAPPAAVQVHHRHRRDRQDDAHDASGLVRPRGSSRARAKRPTSPCSRLRFRPPRARRNCASCSAAMQDAKANFAEACQAIDEAAGFIDNRHRLAEIQVALLSSSRLDPSVRFVDGRPGWYRTKADHEPTPRL